MNEFLLFLQEVGMLLKQPVGVALFVSAIFAGIVPTFVLLRRRSARQSDAQFEAGLRAADTQHQIEIEQVNETLNLTNQRLAETERALELAQAAMANVEEQFAEARAEHKALQHQLTESLSTNAAQSARLDEAEKGFAQREKLFRENSAQLKQEFERLANRVFETQEVKQKAKLQSVLTPFREQILDFRKRVDEVYHSDAKERASLLTEVRNLQQASERINEEAENLTKALKGDKKLQGNWGELVLERVLEESGLRKDHEYFVQASRRTEDGELKRPDVLIRLPDNKDVVVDAKVSLNAYEEALASEDDTLRGQLIAQHLLHLRNHVKRLSDQSYDDLPDVRSLDFVLMFVPIESAFTLAMEHDAKMFTDAFAQRIVIVSPTTLMMTLRIINNVWRYEKQNRNAQEIARRAGALYDKLRGLVEEMEVLGKQLGTVDKTYQSVRAKLSSGRGNLVRQVEQFRELGAVVKKPMEQKLVEAAMDGDSDGLRNVSQAIEVDGETSNKDDEADASPR